MATCEPCRRDYEESQEAVTWLGEHWPISQDTRILLQDTCPRAQGRSFGKATQPCWRVGRTAAWAVATAACLVVGILGPQVTSNRGASVTGRQAPLVASSREDEHLVIEWMNDGSRITPGAAIQTSAREIRSLVLNGKHQLVMNAGARLSIEPSVDKGSIGCAVNLDLGEVYVRVKHDGNPFIVQTAQGRAVITGTTFDLKATEVATSLVVVEGRVRFESEAGAVQVTAGQRSTISGTLTPPDAPAACNTAALTAWAEAVESIRPLAQDIVRYEDFLPGDAVPFPPPGAWNGFKGVEYTRWVQLNRDWFQRQFPSMFRLKAALAQEGVKVDYPELLLESALVWQFAYPPAGQDRLLAVNEAALLKAASHYGKDLPWLRDRALLPVAGTTTDEQKRMGEAFALWQNELVTAMDSGQEVSRALLLDSLHASVYLRQTRSLIWLAAETGQYSLRNLTKAQLQTLLQAEVTAADNNVRGAIQLLATERLALPCDSDRCRQLVRRLCEMIARITQTEGKLAEEMTPSFAPRSSVDPPLGPRLGGRTRPIHLPAPPVVPAGPVIPAQAELHGLRDRTIPHAAAARPLGPSWPLVWVWAWTLSTDTSTDLCVLQGKEVIAYGWNMGRPVTRPYTPGEQLEIGQRA